MFITHNQLHFNIFSVQRRHRFCLSLLLIKMNTTKKTRKHKESKHNQCWNSWQPCIFSLGGGGGSLGEVRHKQKFLWELWGCMLLGYKSHVCKPIYSCLNWLPYARAYVYKMQMKRNESAAELHIEFPNGTLLWTVNLLCLCACVRVCVCVKISSPFPRNCHSVFIPQFSYPTS